VHSFENFDTAQIVVASSQSVLVEVLQDLDGDFSPVAQAISKVGCAEPPVILMQVRWRYLPWPARRIAEKK
jgi:hypothetical protein